MVKEIQLTQGKVALVDDEDYAWLNQWKWNAVFDHGNWYATRPSMCNGKRRTTYMHREILGTPKGMKSDHKDGDGLHNWRENLRVCTNIENCQNRKTIVGKKSSVFKGVHWDKTNNRWRAAIKLNGVTKKLGRFKSEGEAAIAYNKAAEKYFGEYARLNIIR